METKNVKYLIDYEFGSGSGCDKLFNSVNEAQWHINTFYTEKEKEDLFIVPVEVDENGEEI